MKTHYIADKSSWIKHLDFIFLDILCLLVSFSAAYALKFHSLSLFSSPTWKSLLLLCLLLDLVLILLTGSFSGVLRRSGSEELIQSFLLALYNFLLCCLALYVLKRGPVYSRTVIILAYVFQFVFSLLARSGWKAHLRRRNLASGRTSILIVGQKETMPLLLRSIHSGFLDRYDVVGVCMPDAPLEQEVIGRIDRLDPHGNVKTEEDTFLNVTSPDTIADYVLQNSVQEVFIGLDPSLLSPKTYQALVDNGKSVHLGIDSMVGFRTDDQLVTTVGSSKALSIGTYSFTARQMLYLGVKRLADILFSLLGTVCLLPLMLIVKICTLCSGDTGSIFYTQARIGQGGRPFRMVKFRSMAADADEILARLLQDPKYRAEWDRNQKFENDPRITRVGRFLRRTSLDEFPQFLNVLKGDMSLVGPRPLVPGELAKFGGLQLYNLVKPGITGWWGCNGRSNTTYDERLELEYYYVKHCSLYLDVLCILRTIGSVLRKEGAK